MPIMELSGIFDFVSRAELLSCMLYPDDQEERQSYKASLIAHRILYSQEFTAQDNHKIEYPRIVDLFKVVLFSKSFDLANKDASILSSEGVIVGNIVKYLLHLDQNKEELSMNKAFSYTENKWRKTLSGDKLVISGQRIGCSESKLKQYWQKYKPVSHYWASLHTKADTDQNILTMPYDDLINFLSASEAFRRLGERTIIGGYGITKRPIFDKDEMWCLPKEIDLPHIAIGIKKTRNTAGQFI